MPRSRHTQLVRRRGNRPAYAAHNPLRSAWNLEDKFVVGYSGNLGRAHEFETILGAAEHLRSDPRIVFLFIGGGHSSDELARRVKESRLEPISGSCPTRIAPI